MAKKKLLDKIANKLGYEKKKKPVKAKPKIVKLAKAKPKTSGECFIKFIEEKGDLKVERLLPGSKKELIDVRDNLTITELYNFLTDWNVKRRK